MSIVKAIVLGALQGITEFLPVSSSGHLVVSRHLMGIGDVPLLFDVLLHVSTLVVVIIIFRRRVWLLLRALYRWIARKTTEDDKVSLKLIPLILLATLCTAVLGFLFKEIPLNERPKIVSVLFLFTGAILILTYFTKNKKDYATIGIKESIVTGIAQGFGVLPGISRAGITISAALFSGMKRSTAGEFSFILSIPAIVGALLVTLKDAEELFAVVSPVALITGVVTSFIVGLISLLLLLRIIKGGKLYLFSIYLLPLGIWGMVTL